MRFLLLLFVSGFFSAISLADTATGISAYDRGDYKKAFHEISETSQHGNMEAMYYLAQMYLQGNGVEKNIDFGIKWMRKAAQLGYADAQVALGYQYDLGEGVTKNYQEAAKLVDRTKTYHPQEAIELAKKMAHARFDETVELHLRMGVDPRNASQQVRGVALLPYGLGKKVRVLVFA